MSRDPGGAGEPYIWRISQSKWRSGLEAGGALTRVPAGAAEEGHAADGQEHPAQTPGWAARGYQCLHGDRDSVRATSLTGLVGRDRKSVV